MATFAPPFAAGDCTLVSATTSRSLTSRLGRRVSDRVRDPGGFVTIVDGATAHTTRVADTRCARSSTRRRTPFAFGKAAPCAGRMSGRRHSARQHHQNETPRSLDGVFSHDQRFPLRMFSRRLRTAKNAVFVIRLYDCLSFAAILCHSSRVRSSG